MLVKTVSLKFIGIFAALINMVTLGVYLEPAISVKILASLSIIQISIPFTAFGISTSLIAKKEEEFQGKSLSGTLPMLIFFVLLLCVFHTLLVRDLISQNIDMVYILSYIFILQLLTGLSEIVRASFGVINGFLAYNLVLLCSAFDLFLYREISTLSIVSAALAVLWVFIKYFSFGKSYSSVETKVSVSGLQKSVSTSVVNQYMHIVTVFANFAGLQTETLAIFSAASRLNILFSWPIFMWMRVGHKNLAVDSDFNDIQEKNTKAKYINVVCLAGVVAAFLISQFTDIDSGLELFGVAVNDLLFVTVVWGVVRVAFLWVFPYETIFVHKGEWMWLFVSISVLLLAGVIIVKVLSFSPLFLMLYIELIFLALRLFFKRIKLSNT